MTLFSVCPCMCVFASFPFDFECGMWNLIVLTPDRVLTVDFA